MALQLGRARPLNLTLPMPDQIPAHICQADAVATTEHPAPRDGDCDGLFREVIKFGRQHSPTGFAIGGVVQCAHQETGGTFALFGHEPTTAPVPNGCWRVLTGAPKIRSPLGRFICDWTPGAHQGVKTLQ